MSAPAQQQPRGQRQPGGQRQPRKPFPGEGGLRQTGHMFALALDVCRTVPKRPFQFREFIQQCWFIASVTILPTALVSIPFGAVIAMQLGSLTRQLGAQSFTGGASVLAMIQQASPIVTALLIAGAGGSAICADLGSRQIRDEIDALCPVNRLQAALDDALAREEFCAAAVLRDEIDDWEERLERWEAESEGKVGVVGGDEEVVVREEDVEMSDYTAAAFALGVDVDVLDGKRKEEDEWGIDEDALREPETENDQLQWMSSWESAAAERGAGDNVVDMLRPKDPDDDKDDA